MIGSILIGTPFRFLASLSFLMFAGYCVYFDNKRRNDPDFKKKLRNRRRHGQSGTSTPTGGAVHLSEKDIETYFMTQIQKGEGLISSGDIEGGVDHLINAILVCSQPSKLLQVLQSTLPMEIFTMMLVKMHALESSERSSPVIVDDDGINALE
ncbi:hypothetical protein KR009_010858 [Drosophila setifemur]|nr:hypothetical protein KR009_010858 [Drosophila setifemur]